MHHCAKQQTVVPISAEPREVSPGAESIGDAHSFERLLHGIGTGIFKFRQLRLHDSTLCTLYGGEEAFAGQPGDIVADIRPLRRQQRGEGIPPASVGLEETDCFAIGQVQAFGECIICASSRVPSAAVKVPVVTCCLSYIVSHSASKLRALIR